MKWKPIKTAPKDGTLVFATVGGAVPSIAKFKDGVWRDDALDSLRPDIAGMYAYIPTHWMPIPKIDEDDK